MMGMQKIRRDFLDKDAKKELARKSKAEGLGANTKKGTKQIAALAENEALNAG